MLDILSQTKNPVKIHLHLNKCFEGMAKLGFDDCFNITSMISKEGEEVLFIKKIITRNEKGCVELWLSKVSNT